MTNKNDILCKLDINLKYKHIDFNNQELRMLEVYGLAIHSAIKINGGWYIHRDGHLSRPSFEEVHGFDESAQEIDLIISTIDIETQASGLITLDKLIKKEIKDNGERPQPHIHYDGGIFTLTAKKTKYIIEEINNDYRSGLTKSFVKMDNYFKNAGKLSEGAMNKCFDKKPR